MDNLYKNNILYEFINNEVQFILNEVRIEDLKDRLRSKKFIKAYAKNLNKEPEEVIEKLNQIGEGGIEILAEAFLRLVPEDIREKEKGESFNWLVNLYILDKLPHDRLLSHDRALRYSFQSALETFFHWKRFYPIKQLNLISSLQELEDMIISKEDEIEEYQAKKSAKNWEEGTNTILKTDKWTIIIPENKGAACYWGAGTKWCTAAPGLDYYEQYHSSEDPLFIIINNSNEKEKYQFSFGTKQFMDIKDHPISSKPIFNELIKLFIPLSNQYQIVKEYFKTNMESLVYSLSKESFRDIMEVLGYEDLYEILPKKFDSIEYMKNADSFHRNFMIFQSRPEDFKKFIKTYAENGFFISDSMVEEIKNRIDNGEFRLNDIIAVLLSGSGAGSISSVNNLLNEFTLSSNNIIELLDTIKENYYNKGQITKEQIGFILRYIFKSITDFDKDVLEYIFSKESDLINLMAKTILIGKINTLENTDTSQIKDFSKFTDQITLISNYIKRAYTDPNEDEGFKIMIKKYIDK